MNGSRDGWIFRDIVNIENLYNTIQNYLNTTKMFLKKKILKLKSPRDVRYLPL